MTLNDGFHLVATAPNGVARLRELVLSLAVMGKLVPQDPADEPARTLLGKIRAEKDRLVTEGTISTDKPLTEIGDKERPFDLPSGWEWARFGDYVIELCTGPFGSVIHKEDYVKDGIPLINPSHMVHGRILHDPSVSVSAQMAEQLSAYRLSAGDIVLARRGEVGRYAHVTTEQEGWLCGTGSFFAKFADDCDRRFMGLVFQDPRMRLYLQGESIGMTMTNLNQRILLEAPLAIPPLAEQARIVTKVDELMCLCNELESRGRLAAEQHARLTATLFEALATSESAHALAENWSRVAAHFDLLLDRPEAVDTLEQTILQFAVRGLLVSQDPNDEPASVVLEEVRAARDRLSARTKISRSKIPSEDNDEPPTAPRLGWEIVTFPDLCIIGGGATPSKSKAAYWDGKLPWVSPKDMKVEHISDAQDHVSELALEETRLPLVPERSLLIVVRGMILAHSFPVGITLAEVTINQDMKSLTPLVPALAPYLALVCRGHKHEILELVDRSTHGTCKLQSDKLFAFRFGLPPLAEQSRILARVEEMRHLCESLRERLTARQTCQVRFAQSLVEQATSKAPLMEDAGDLVATA